MKVKLRNHLDILAILLDLCHGEVSNYRTMGMIYHPSFLLKVLVRLPFVKIIKNVNAVNKCTSDNYHEIRER
jgi:hypothetical protein